MSVQSPAATREGAIDPRLRWRLHLLPLAAAVFLSVYGKVVCEFIATIALAELYGEARVAAIRPVLQRLVRVIEASQSDKGGMVGDPDVLISGLPKSTRDGAGIDALIDTAIFETFESLPRGKRRDADFVSGAIERAVRNAVGGVWGKKPMVHVLVIET